MSKKLNQPRKFNKTNLRGVPVQSGIYVLRNRKGEVQYVGKAGGGRLRERLSEHFNRKDVPGAELFQSRTTTSGREAVMLEERDKKRLKPKHGE